MKIQKINVESYPLAVDEALSKVQTEIEVLSFGEQTKVLKVIHGYGSRGVGGKIKIEIIPLLQTLCKQGKILDFIPNEKFTPQNEKYLTYTKLYPELILDADLQNQNPGITLIFLN